MPGEGLTLSVITAADVGFALGTSRCLTWQLDASEFRLFGACTVQNERGRVERSSQRQRPSNESTLSAVTTTVLVLRSVRVAVSHGSSTQTSSHCSVLALFEVNEGVSRGRVNDKDQATSQRFRCHDDGVGFALGTSRCLTWQFDANEFTLFGACTV
jgi:hypothetical protein